MENDIIDLHGTMEKLSCDIKEALKMLEMYIFSIQEDLPRFKDAYKNNDIAQTRELFHKMKGGLCYCSLPQLTKIINELHSEVKKTNKLSSLASLYIIFYQEVDKINRQYYQIKKLSANKNKPI